MYAYGAVACATSAFHRHAAIAKKKVHHAQIHNKTLAESLVGCNPVHALLDHPQTSGDWAAWVPVIGVLGSISVAIGLSRVQPRQQVETELRSRWRRLAFAQAIVDDTIGLIGMSCSALRNQSSASEYAYGYSLAEARDSL
ncbi:hypothetical protein NE850_33785 [Paraburkholderia sp. USG1]|nr:hypothetical protein [Paraburkholderia sp. USG1]